VIVLLVEEIAWTSELKEAYEFARYINLKSDVENVSVEHVNELEYKIHFTINDNAQARKEIMDIAREFDFRGLVFGNAWG